jgi:hypothetical protein
VRQTVEKIRTLKPNLYMVTGGGANTLIRVTPDGLIVVDTKNPGDENFNRLMEEIKSVSPLPVKCVINTQHHPDHVGTTRSSSIAGAQVSALEALKTCMASDPRTKEIPGLPTQTFAKDYTSEVRRRRSAASFVRPRPLGRRHDGLLSRREGRHGQRSDHRQRAARRLRERRQRGRWAPILDGVLKLDFEMAIPGRGEPKTRAEVEAYRTKIATVVTRASDAIKAGATRDTLASQVKTDDIGWNFNAQFYGSLYDELTKK